MIRLNLLVRPTPGKEERLFWVLQTKIQLGNRGRNRLTLIFLSYTRNELVLEKIIKERESSGGKREVMDINAGKAKDSIYFVTVYS